MPSLGFQSVPEFLPNAVDHRRQLAQAINRIMQGKVNAYLDYTIPANTASSTITDARISPYSAILFMPLTAHAAAELATGNMYVPTATMNNGSAIIQHTNNAQTDRTFRSIIIG